MTTAMSSRFGRDFRMELTPTTERVITALVSAGFDPLIVGGSVRDQLLGFDSKDVDIEVFKAPSFKAVEKALRPVGRVNRAGQSFGVLKLTVGEEDFDVSLPRRDSKVADGHAGFEVEVDPTMDYREAAGRRDFTINALMYSPVRRELVDEHGGLADLEARVLRHTTEAFSEDPLRVLRGVQMAGRFGFKLALETVELARALKPRCGELASERVVGEFDKLMRKASKPSLSLATLRVTEWDENIGTLASVNDEELWAALDRATHAEDKTLTMAAVIACRLLENGVDPRPTLNLLVNGKRVVTDALALARLPRVGESNFDARLWAFEAKPLTARQHSRVLAALFGDDGGLRLRMDALGLLDGPEPDELDGRELMARFPERKPGPWMKEELHRARLAQFARD